MHELPRWFISRRNLKSGEVVMQVAAKITYFPADAAEAVVEGIVFQDVDYVCGLASTDKRTPSAIVRRDLFMSRSLTIFCAYYTQLLSSTAPDSTRIRWAFLAFGAVFFVLYLFLLDRFSQVTSLPSTSW
ncbi:hypothetical protein MRX96_001613 [Rhipicephalus microplus]